MTGAEFLIPLIGGVASAAISRPKEPKLPPPEPVKRMPDPEAPQVLEARRRKLAEQQNTSGRSSTILSDDDYSNTLLGQ